MFMRTLIFFRFSYLLASFIAVLSIGLTACGGGGGDGNAIPAANNFYATSTVAIQDGSTYLPGQTLTPQAFNNQTVRQVLRLSIPGDLLRVKLSNKFGTVPLTFSGVHIAKSTGQSNTDITTDRTLTFNGQSSVTLAPGTEVNSDPFSMTGITPLTSVAISSYFSGPSTVQSTHITASHTTYVSAGNQLAAASTPGTVADNLQSYYGIAEIDASVSTKPKVIVTFGDSITDGVASTLDALQTYPDQLDSRLKAANVTNASVVNEGIGGNRWLHDITGQNGNSRFARDVLGVAGVTHVIILLGINDIGYPSLFSLPGQEVTADQIITSIRAAVASAKAQGIKVFLGTLTPFKGAFYYTADGEAKREAVNAWIRAAPGVDGVFDFDLAVQSKSDPLMLEPTFNSGDHLHPNDAGYAAMAAAVDIAKLQ